NLESVPRLSALAVRLALDDPLRRPYLFAWKLDNRRHIAGVAEIPLALTLRRHDRFREWPRGPSAELWIGQARQGSTGWSEVGTVYRRLPRGLGTGLLLLCRYCGKPKRFLYCWAKDGHRRTRWAGWSCRVCAGLSFASEGQYDVLGWGFPRQQP